MKWLASQQSYLFIIIGQNNQEAFVNIKTLIFVIVNVAVCFLVYIANIQTFFLKNKYFAIFLFFLSGWWDLNPHATDYRFDTL